MIFVHHSAADRHCSTSPFRLNFSVDNQNSIFTHPIFLLNIYTWPGTCISVDNKSSVWASETYLLSLVT